MVPMILGTYKNTETMAKSNWFVTAASGVSGNMYPVYQAPIKSTARPLGIALLLAGFVCHLVSLNHLLLSHKGFP